MTQNQLLTISDITNESLMVMENECVFVAGINRDYDDRFGITGAQIGTTINVRRPPRYTVTEGPNLSIQPTVENFSPLSLTNQSHVDTQFSTLDLALNMESFSKKVIKPIMATLASKIDGVAMQMAKNQAFTQGGTPGTLPSSLTPFLLAQAYLDAEACPRDGSRAAYTDPFTNVSLAGSLLTYFNPQAAISETFRKGQMGRDMSGMNWLMDQNVVNHTYGTCSATPTISINGAGQGMTAGWAQYGTINITTAQTLNLNIGDTFTVAGVYGVNPVTQQPYRQLRNFVLTQPVVAGTGAQTLSVSPPLIVSGPFQNCSVSPAAGAALSFTSLTVGAAGTGVVSPQSIICHKNAFTLGMADLVLPEGVQFAGRAADKETGMSVRIVRQYTINNDAIPARFDTLYGVAPLYPEWSFRMAG